MRKIAANDRDVENEKLTMKNSESFRKVSKQSRDSISIVEQRERASFASRIPVG